jgi:hypothetical protein
MPSLSAEDVGRFVSHTSSPDLHGPRGSASASLPAYYFSHDHTSTTPPLYQQPFHLSPPTLMPPPSTEYLDYDEMPVRTYHSNDFSPVPDSVPPSYSASQSYSTHTPPPEARTSSFPITDYIKRGRGRDAPAMVGGPYDEVSTERCFICQIPGCARGFLRLEHLRRHVRSIHTDDKREWIVDFCRALALQTLNFSSCMPRTNVWYGVQPIGQSPSTFQNTYPYNQTFRIADILIIYDLTFQSARLHFKIYRVGTKTNSTTYLFFTYSLLYCHIFPFP